MNTEQAQLITCELERRGAGQPGAGLRRRQGSRGCNMELLLLRCQCVRSQPLPSMSGHVFAQHTNAFPGDTAWRRLTSPPKKERPTFAVRPRALRKEPPIDSHQQRASLSPPRSQGFDPGTSSLLLPSSR
eukprot:1146415-Pelagomonas_calceolata.AAC.1